jgi:hypothetical protein
LRIRIERDPAFWEAIAGHPQVSHVLHGETVDWGQIAGSPAITPYAAEHGGFLVADKGNGERELHTMFTPEGWGREVHAAALLMHEAVFRDADVLTTFESDHPQSRPPRSFGWKPTDEVQNTAYGAFRKWAVTKDDWENSPARRRKCQ